MLVLKIWQVIKGKEMLQQSLYLLLVESIEK